MKLPVRLPQFGESAAEATVVAWLVQPGSAVAAEQELVEVQTEKSLMTVSAPQAGILAGHCARPGDKVAVGDVIAELEVAEGSAPAAPAAPVGRSAPPSNAPRPVAAQARGSAAVSASAGDQLFLSPRVRATLLECGLKLSDLAFIRGTGAGGRVTPEDIQGYVAHGEPMPAIRQAVAAAMSRSWERPLATVAMNARFDALLAHRRTVPGRPSATIYGMRALALALAAGNPLRSRLHGNRLLTPKTVDLAVAVEVDDGVLTPVVRQVEALGLEKLTAAVEEVIARARAGRVADAGDAVASVSNYGVFGITWATPIPLPGQGLILGIGDLRNQPDWNPSTKSWDRIRCVELTLTFDHRVADGGAAGRLLGAVRDLLEHPERLG